LHQTDGFFAAVFEKSAAAKPALDAKAETVDVITEADELAIKAERKKAAISKSKALTRAATKEPAKKATPKKAAPKKAKA
jgi:hypothetical protein